MPRLILFVVAILVAAAGGIIAGRLFRPIPSGDEEPVASRTVSVSPQRVDFGTVPQNGQYEAEFRVINRFPRAIDVVRFTHPRDCTSVSCDKSVIGPNEDGLVRLKWNSGMARGDTEFVVFAICQVTGEDQSAFGLRLVCRAHVDCKYDCDPNHVTFTVGRSQAQQVTIARRPVAVSSARPVAIGVQSSHPAITATITSTEKESTVRATFSASDWGAAVGESHLLITINDEDGGGKMVIPIAVVSE